MNIDKLETVADAATPGPWMLATSCSWRRFLSVMGDSVCEPVKQNDGHPDLYFKNGGPDGPDATYIAAMSPDVAKELIAIARAAQAALEDLENGCTMTPRDTLRAALATLNQEQP